MAYVNYEFYASYSDKVPQEVFDRLAYKASRFIDKVTFGRAKAVTDEETLEAIKYAACEMCDCLHTGECRRVEGREVESVSNDGYSVTFAKEIDSTGNLIRKELYQIAEEYLPCELLSFDLRD